MIQPPSADDHARALFKRMVLRLVTVAYVFGLLVGCVLTLWIMDCN